MKFVCRRCEAFMLFDEVEGVREDSLGVTFGCPQCGARIAMVTNAGETQMVRALGVQLGGRSEAPQPLELTRQSLSSGPPPRTSEEPRKSPAESLKDSMGKCPFANALAGMGAKEAGASPAAGKPPQPSDPAQIRWSPEAEERLKKVPDFVRPFARTMIEELARQRGSDVVDGSLMDSAKEKFM